MSASIRTIAKEAGVSPITASRALREGDPRVSEATRRRVLSVANKQGYRPSTEIARLMTGVRLARDPRYQSNLAVMVLSSAEASPSEWMPYTRAIFTGIERRAKALGFGIDIFNPRSRGSTPARIARILNSRNITGVLILPSRQNVVHLNFPWDKFSAISVTHSLWSPQLHRVVPHQYRAMQEAIHQLRHLGYRRIGLALRSGVDRRTNYLFTSFYLTYQTLLAEPKNRIPPFVSQMGNLDRAFVGFKKWMGKYEPDAIVTLADWCSDFLRNRMNLTVPRDIGLVYLNLGEAPQGASGIEQDPATVGEVAVNQLADMINRNERGIPKYPVVHMVEGRWVAGNTTTRQKKRTPQK